MKIWGIIFLLKHLFRHQHVLSVMFLSSWEFKRESRDSCFMLYFYSVSKLQCPGCCSLFSCYLFPLFLWSSFLLLSLSLLQFIPFHANKLMLLLLVSSWERESQMTRRLSSNFTRISEQTVMGRKKRDVGSDTNISSWQDKAELEFNIHVSFSSYSSFLFVLISTHFHGCSFHFYSMFYEIFYVLWIDFHPCSFYGFILMLVCVCILEIYLYMSLAAGGNLVDCRIWTEKTGDVREGRLK